MRSGDHSTFDLAVLIFVQAFFGSAVIMPLKEEGAPWSVIYAVLAGAGCLGGLVLIGFALRNCVRLWRTPRGSAATRTLVALAAFALICGLSSSGPFSVGVWRWDATLFAALAFFFVAIFGRELTSRTGRSVESNPDAEGRVS